MTWPMDGEKLYLYFELSWTGAPRRLAVSLSRGRCGHDVYVREVVPKSNFGDRGHGRCFHVAGDERIEELARRVVHAASEVVGREVTVEVKDEPRLGPIT